ncbi:uncharacterized protein TNCT_690211 [Trichonephila clavata]|uniref:Uncharacterized protein n=1 Tax=Trichonephila clavata TaxID=2740835 RepID=A0A8X6KWM8_TRICU|nr:uncharacterized protein TNCT_690211 [Trichonephila clavata]
MYSDEDDDSEEMIEEFDLSDEFAHENEVPQNTDTFSKLEIVPEVLSLQNICLQTISDNLERFNEAVTTTTDTKFRMHLYYLRRVHTPFFLNNKLKEDNGILKKKYWDFLLTEYLKEFNLSTIELKDWDDLMMKLDEIGHTYSSEALITFAKIDGCFGDYAKSSSKINYRISYKTTPINAMLLTRNLPIKGFEKVNFDINVNLEFEPMIRFVNKMLFKFPNVNILYLYKYCKDTTLEILATCCPKLEELDITNSCITDKGIIRMCQEKDNVIGTHYLKLKLISLSSSRGKVNDGVIYLLKSMPSLEVIRYPYLGYIMLDMYNNNLHKAFEDQYNLTYLEIPRDVLRSSDDVGKILTIFKECCPHIKEISTAVKSVNDLQVISKFTELTDLSIQGPYADVNFNWFLECKGKFLKKLKINSLLASPAVIIQNCLNLEFLSFNSASFVHIRSRDISNILYNLKEIVFSEYNLCHYATGNTIIAILSSSPVLKKITFNKCIINRTRDFIDEFSRFTKNSVIDYFKFKSCDVTINFLQAIFKTTITLKTLVLELCGKVEEDQVHTLNQITRPRNYEVEIFWIDSSTQHSDTNMYSFRNYPDRFSYGLDNRKRWIENLCACALGPDIFL